MCSHARGLALAQKGIIPSSGGLIFVDSVKNEGTSMPYSGGVIFVVFPGFFVVVGFCEKRASFLTGVGEILPLVEEISTFPPSPLLVAM